MTYSVLCHTSLLSHVVNNREIFIRKSPPRAWGGSSLGQGFAPHECGPKFNPVNLCKKNKKKPSV